MTVAWSLWTRQMISVRARARPMPRWSRRPLWRRLICPSRVDDLVTHAPEVRGQLAHPLHTCGQRGTRSGTPGRLRRGPRPRRARPRPGDAPAARGREALVELDRASGQYTACAEAARWRGVRRPRPGGSAVPSHAGGAATYGSATVARADRGPLGEASGVLSHHAAAEQHGAPDLPEQLHMTVPRRRRLSQLTAHT